MNLKKYFNCILFFIASFLCLFLYGCGDNKDDINTGISSVDELNSIMVSKNNMSELFDASDDDSERSDIGAFSVLEDRKEPDFISIGESSESSGVEEDSFTNVSAIPEDLISDAVEQSDPAISDNASDKASSENNMPMPDDELGVGQADSTAAEQSSDFNVDAEDNTDDTNISPSENELYEVKDSGNNISNGKSTNNESEDQKNVSIVGANDDNSTTYVLNTNTKKFHYSYCSSVTQMKAKNKKTAQGRASIISSGYEPCKRCNP